MKEESVLSSIVVVLSYLGRRKRERSQGTDISLILVIYQELYMKIISSFPLKGQYINRGESEAYKG